MSYQSKNMNYVFHYEYFEHIYEQSPEQQKKTIKDRNAEILKFAFPKETPMEALKEVENFHEFSLYTTYPGLLVGTGNPHEIAVDGAIKLGFTFDYVTGHPYISGSSLKGMLRSYFPEQMKDSEKSKNLAAFICGILGKDDLDVAALEHNIFENDDVFYGAYPIADGNDKTMLAMEHITSHKEAFKSPIPVSLVKVKPDVKFTFGFALSDYADEESGEVLVSAREKAVLFKELILAMGIGARTNVGYGRFAEKQAGPNAEVSREAWHEKDRKGSAGNHRDKQKEPKAEFSYADSGSIGNTNLFAPKCKNKRCRNKVAYNSKTGSYEEYCVACAKLNNK